MKLNLQKMIDERHDIVEKLTNAMVEGRDMSIREYANLNDRYHWLNDRIIKKELIRKGKI